MDCHDVTNRFSDLRDGHLRGEELVELERHLATCLACRQEWVEFQKAIDALRDLGAVEPDPGFAARVRAITETPPWHRRWARWLFMPWHIKLPLEAVALVLLAIGAVFIYRRTPEMRQVVEQPVVRQAPTPMESDRRDATRIKGSVAREEQGVKLGRPVAPPPTRALDPSVSQPPPQAGADVEQSGRLIPGQGPSPEMILPAAPSPPMGRVARARRELDDLAPTFSRQEGRPIERLESGASRESPAQAPAQPAPTPFRIMSLWAPDVAAAAERVRGWALQAGGRLLDTPATGESTPSGQRILSLIIPVQAVPRLDALLAELGQVFGKELAVPTSNEVVVSLTISPKPPPPPPPRDQPPRDQPPDDQPPDDQPPDDQ